MRRKLVALVGDEGLFVKFTTARRVWLDDAAKEAPAHKGANRFRVDAERWDDAE